MDGFNMDIAGCRKQDYRYSCEINEDIVLSLPNFSTIERFLTVGGGKANDIYDNMMSIVFPKSNDPPLNIMNKLKNKATMNLHALLVQSMVSMVCLESMTTFSNKNIKGQTI